MTINSAAHPTDIRADPRAVTATLAEAVAVAGHAPSIRNTQPWRWHLAGDGLDLHLESNRLLDVTHPDTRLATLSCGAALHHARVSLPRPGSPPPKSACPSRHSAPPPKWVSTRQAIRILLSSVGYPYLVLRLGTTEPDQTGPPHAPRLPTDRIIDSQQATGDGSA